MVLLLQLCCDSWSSGSKWVQAEACKKFRLVPSVLQQIFFWSICSTGLHFSSVHIPLKWNEILGMEPILWKALSSYISFWCIVTRRLSKFVRTCAPITIMYKQFKGLSEKWFGKGCELCGGLISGNCCIQFEVIPYSLLHSYYLRASFLKMDDFELNTFEFLCKIFE